MVRTWGQDQIGVALIAQGLHPRGPRHDVQVLLVSFVSHFATSAMSRVQAFIETERHLLLVPVYDGQFVDGAPDLRAAAQPTTPKTRNSER